MMRRTQVGWSIAWGALGLLLATLWARSYSRLDRVDWPLGRMWPGWTFATASAPGLILCGIQPEQYNRFAAEAYTFRFNTERLNPRLAKSFDRGIFGFKLFRGSHEWGIQFPYAAAIAIVALCGSAPWLRRGFQYRLRTLLIIVTVISVALGALAIGM